MKSKLVRLPPRKCWPHLLRDVAAVETVSTDLKAWKSFSRRLVGVYRNGKNLHPLRATMAADSYDMFVTRLDTRISVLSNETWEHPDASRLAKRLNKRGSRLLTFLWHSDVPSDNNACERAIRPAMLIRKNR